MADAEESLPYIFRSYDHWGFFGTKITELNPGIAHSIPIWEAARATTAAPTYFDPIMISNRKFGDGGFGTNNPVWEMFWEVTHMNGGNAINHGIELLLSIGTGEAKPIRRIGTGCCNKYWTYLNAARQLASQSADAERNIGNIQGAFNIPYYRFNVPPEKNLWKIKLDEWRKPSKLLGRKGTLERIERITDEYCDQTEVTEQIKQVARILVDNRRKRAESDMWGLVASGKQYRCTVMGCRKQQELRPREGDLKAHLVGYHQITDEGELENLLKEGVFGADASAHNSHNT